MISWTIIKNDLQQRRWTILMWSLIWGLLALMVFSLFDTVLSQQKDFAKLIDTYPQELAVAFNLDSKTMFTISGFYATEFFILFVLINAVYAVYLGANSIGKEINEKIMPFLLTKPLTRTQIYLSKTVANMTVLFFISFLVMLFSYLGVILFTDKAGESWFFFVISLIGGMILHIFFLLIGQLLGMAVRDGRGMLLGIGFAFATWLLDTLARLEGFPSFLRYFSPFYYFDINYVVRETALNFNQVSVLVTMSILLLLAGVIYFKRKNIYL